MARRVRARPRDLGARRLRRASALVAASAAAFAAVWVARGVPSQYLLLTIAPFVVAVVLFVAAAAMATTARANVLALGAVAPFAAWATEYSYAPPGRPIVFAALIACAIALAGIVALPRTGRIFAALVAGVTAAVLVTLALAPFALPVGGLWLEAVTALCGTGLAIALVPWRWWIVLAAGIVGWVGAAAAVLAAYGLPLGPN